MINAILVLAALIALCAGPVLVLEYYACRDGDRGDPIGPWALYLAAVLVIVGLAGLIALQRAGAVKFGIHGGPECRCSER